MLIYDVINTSVDSKRLKDIEVFCEIQLDMRRKIYHNNPAKWKDTTPLSEIPIDLESLEKRVLLAILAGDLPPDFKGTADGEMAEAREKALGDREAGNVAFKQMMQRLARDTLKYIKT